MDLFLLLAEYSSFLVLASTWDPKVLLVEKSDMPLVTVRLCWAVPNMTGDNMKRKVSFTIKQTLEKKIVHL